ncbi:MAG: thioredoxin domain-containing protein [Chitinophagales bacterium]
MRNLLGSILLLLPLWLLAGEEPESKIRFESSTWSAVLSKAKAEKKLIFVDAYASWCGPCKKMAREVFTNDTAGDFYNTNMINVKMDMEVGEGLELAKKYHVKAYPTFLFVNGDGVLVHRSVGARPVRDFVDMGANAMSPDHQISTLNQRYASGEREFAFMKKYLLALLDADEPYDSVYRQYIVTQRDAQLGSEDNRRIIFHCEHQPLTREHRFMEANLEGFEKRYGEAYVKHIVEENYQEALAAIIQSSPKQYQHFRDTFMMLNVEAASAAAISTDVDYYLQMKDWIAYRKSAELYLSRHDDANSYNSVAYSCYEKCKDRTTLQWALDLAEKSVSMSENEANLDTYACLLYATGNKKQAIITEEKALNLALQSGHSAYINEFRKNLKKFRGK